MRAKYVNPFTDFGFKKIFGEEASKPMLIDFLNSLLPEMTIVDLSLKDKEKLGRSEYDRKSVYDIYCENSNGEKIIVELQKAKQNYFIDRTIYYSTFPIQEQAEKGDWDYELNAVFCIGILDFRFDADPATKEDIKHIVQLKNQNNQVFYDKLKFVYLEMPNFKKTEQELESRLDKWLYFIKHLEDFQTIPEIFKDTVFTQAFEKAELAKYTYDERHEYEMNLKVYRDNKNTFDYAMNEGKALAFEEGIKKGQIEGTLKGILEGKLEAKHIMAKLMLENNEPIEKIIQYTGLTKIQIEQHK